MAANRSEDWMWSQALTMLARVERMRARSFEPRRSAGRLPVWEPPIDVLETDEQVLIIMALPGVDPDQVETVIAEGALVIAGQRILPPELQSAVIHRLELPQGHFERRVPLPPGRYDAVRRTARNGCLFISLHKAI